MPTTGEFSDIQSSMIGPGQLLLNTYFTSLSAVYMIDLTQSPHAYVWGRKYHNPAFSYAYGYLEAVYDGTNIFMDFAFPNGFYHDLAIAKIDPANGDVTSSKVIPQLKSGPNE